MRTDRSAEIRHVAEQIDALAPDDPRDYQRTDMGNGRRFARTNAERALYVNPWGWRVYDRASGAWRVDPEALMRMAKKTVKGIYAESASENDSSERKKTAAHAMRSESVRALKAMIEMAQSEIVLKAEPREFDADPWLLNVVNGTVDLRSGELLPHNPDYRITKVAGCAYDQHASCPTWLSHLYRIMSGDEESIAFLQRLLGYCLTGITTEQVVSVWYGTGANGKSVTEEAVRGVLGDYATGSDFRTFMVARQDGPRNDLARLAGARFVTASESSADQQLNEALIKQATGGEPLTVRFLHQEHFEYVPQFKLALLTNHKPEIRGTDSGIWRRIRLIPFTVTIPPAEQDKELAEKLRAELPGILKWMVVGCLAWQREGLDPPQSICEATAAYRSEMDVIGTFLADCTTVDEHASMPVFVVFRAYEAWAKRTGERPMNNRRFNAALVERGISVKGRQSGTGRALCWGIRLAEDGSEREPEERF